MREVSFRKFGKNYYVSEALAYVRVAVYSKPIGEGGDKIGEDEYQKVSRYGYFSADDFNERDRARFGIDDSAETYFCLWDEDLGKHVYTMSNASILIAESEVYA